MEKLKRVSEEITSLVKEWEPYLAGIDERICSNLKNSQNRTVKQIVGHLVDSASNNLHRIVHLQYRKLPLDFPDYANLGVNDKWIELQNYQNEDWPLLLHIWKYSNLHLAHVITNISQKSYANLWISALEEKVTLLDMVEDYPRHFKLHLQEIATLAGLNAGVNNNPSQDVQQVAFYTSKLA